MGPGTLECKQIETLLLTHKREGKKKRAKKILEVKDTTNTVAKEKPTKIQPESSTICSCISESRSDDITKTKFVQSWDSLAYRKIPKISPSKYKSNKAKTVNLPSTIRLAQSILKRKFLSVDKPLRK